MTTTTETDPAALFMQVSLELLQESPTNPRRVFDPAALQDLVASVREHGVLQPILVRQVGAAFEVIAGARRFRAAKAAGLETVPCIVRELSDKQVLEIQFVENLQRSDLHPLDEGQGYRKLHEEFGYSVGDLAGKLNKSASYVYSRMQLARLPVSVQTLLFDGAIDLGHAMLLVRIPVPELAERAAKEIAKGVGTEAPMSARTAAEHVRRNYQCDLRLAAFPDGDKDLVPEAGACGPCPKRTGNQKGLFEQSEGAEANVCTDPKCFAAKRRAFWERQKAEALAKGGEVIEGKAARTAQYSSDFVSPDDKDYGDEKHRTWRQLCRGQKVKPVLIENGNGAGELKWRATDVHAALLANGHVKEAKKQKAAAAKSGIDQFRLRDETQARAMSMVVDRVREMPIEVVLRGIVADTAFGMPATEACSKRWKLDLRAQRRFAFVNKATTRALAGMPTSELAALCVDLLMESYADAWCEYVGVDIAAIEADVRAAMKQEAKEAAKTAAAAAKSEPAQSGKGKPKAAAKAKGARA